MVVFVRTSWNAVRPALIPLLAVASLTTTTGVAAMAASPSSRLQLSDPLQQAIANQQDFYSAPLIPLEFQKDQHKNGDENGSELETLVKELPGTTLKEAAQTNSNQAGSIAFVVRRPG